MASAKRRAFLATIWTLIGYGGSQSLRLVSNLILTRLLVPELFGLMSLITTFIVGLHLFSDIGIGASLIQNRRGDEPKFYNTAWTLQVVRGISIWLLSIPMAYIAVQVYEDSRLWLLIVVAFGTSIFGGFESIAEHLLSRRVQQGRQQMLFFTTQISAIVITAVWAYFDKSIWALVVGNLVSTFLAMILSYYLLIPGIKHRFTWDKESVRAIAAFGKWIFISTAVTYIAMQADRIILPKLESFEALGIYTVAYTFAYLPQQIVSQLSTKVLFPLFSEFAELPRQELRQKILNKRRLLLFAIALFVALVVSFGDYLIIFLYDERYRKGAWILPILAFGIWPNVLFDSISKVLMAVGKPQYHAFANMSKAVFVCLSYPLGFFWFGFPGFVTAVALNDLPIYFACLFGLERENLSSLRQDIEATIVFVIITALLVGARLLLNLGLPIQTLYN
ncbi:MAG: oligosaccharide flippase family protein [Jaaginema sp. PMC 1079.18]|nr:oligosaccharide flippase family protein [Jaaginema sp. PMC 1080.18]MEC4849472.1 oligosaccharide flippase family protein [Jaaginema sp. PMC 1079.18]MEC4866024.1 oligosaccharide flippase family protein [Jaaginema sp. PMC 1078.18]